MIPAAMLSHDATITGERQVDTVEDDFGGISPVIEEESVEIKCRYEPSGAGLLRDFAGERSEDDPITFVPAYELGDFDVQEDDVIEYDGLDGKYEIRNVEPHSFRGPDPEYFVFNPVRIDG